MDGLIYHQTGFPSLQVDPLYFVWHKFHCAVKVSDGRHFWGFKMSAFCLSFSVLMLSKSRVSWRRKLVQLERDGWGGSVLLVCSWTMASSQLIWLVSVAFAFLLLTGRRLFHSTLGNSTPISIENREDVVVSVGGRILLLLRWCVHSIPFSL